MLCNALNPSLNFIGRSKLKEPISLAKETFKAFKRRLIVDCAGNAPRSATFWSAPSVVRIYICEGLEYLKKIPNKQLVIIEPGLYLLALRFATSALLSSFFLILCLLKNLLIRELPPNRVRFLPVHSSSALWISFLLSRFFMICSFSPVKCLRCSFLDFSQNPLLLHYYGWRHFCYTQRLK